MAAALVIVLALVALPGRTLARVLLIGDSITEGTVSGTPGSPYAAVVATDLGPEFDVLNLGCGGASSFDWRPDTGVTICGGLFIDLWAQRVLPNVPAEIATVMLGTNDATGFFEAVGGLIVCGPTHTNVNDFRVILVDP